MSWIDELLPASFRGVPFHVKGDNASFGRRNQTHEFPFRDEPFTQDLGRSARQYAIDAYIVGDNFIDNEKRLIQAIEATGSGVLVHPFYGELSVNIVGTVRVSHSSDAGRMCSISFNFIESGEVHYPDVSVSTSDAILAQANAVDTTLSQSLVDFNFTKLPDFIQSEMLSSTQAALNEINYVLGYANAQVKTAIDALSGNLSSVLSGPSHQLLTSLTGVWRNAEQVMYSVDGLIALSHTLSSVSDMKRLVPSQAWPTDSGSNQTRKHHQNHLNQVIRISALNASSRLIAMLPKQQITKHIIHDELTFQAVSIQDANEVKPLPMTFDDLMEIKKRINQTFHQESERAQNDAIYLALSKLKTTVNQDINDRLLKMDKTIVFMPNDVLPDLVLANLLYGDATRHIDISARNAITHPGFIPVKPLRVIKP